jgi:transposase-like protein
MGRCEERSGVLTVLDDATAESALAAGELRCPSCCTGRLRRWGYARRRQLRHLRGQRHSVRPRRSRCDVCSATHVLLPADVPPRHADTLEVVLNGLLAAQHGGGCRTIAADLGVPVDTVRAWLRRVRGRAESVQRVATLRAHELDPMLDPILPTGSPLGDALNALGHAAAATRCRLGMAGTPAQHIGLITAGRLLAPLATARAG